MALFRATKSQTHCPPDSQLTLQLLGSSDLCTKLVHHIQRCPSCANRQASLLDRAAAFTSLRFTPLQWEAFRCFRLLQQPVHQVALDLGLTWREVWAASAAILHAIHSTMQSPDFLNDQLHPSEFTHPD